MAKIIKTLIKAVPLLLGLFRSKPPDQGKGFVRSGVASLIIAGLLSTGRLSESDIDGTLLLILSILEAIGYLYGTVAISSGAAKTDAARELLKGKAEGTSSNKAKILGREWLKQIGKNQDYKPAENSLFDDDHSDLKIQAKDISQHTNHNKTKSDL